MLLAEQDHPRHQVIEIARAERARPAHIGLRIFAAGTDQVDIGMAVDLAAAKKESIEPSLPCKVEQLDAAVAEEIVPDAAEHVDPQAERKSVVSGKGVGVRLDAGDGRTIQKQKE